MKIAIVTEAAETHSGSRAETELAKQFSKLGHEVSFYAHQSKSSKEGLNELTNAKVKVNLINSPNIKFIGKFFGGLSLYQKLKQEKPNIISSHATIPLLIGAKLSGIPVVATYYGNQTDVYFDKIFPKNPNFLDKLINNFLNLIIRNIAKIQILLATKIITQSLYCQRELKILYGIKAPVIFWGSAPPHIQKIKPIKNSGKYINLLSVSRIIPYKSFHILIEIISNLNLQFNNLILTIIGSHPDKKYLTYLKKNKPNNVKIIVNASDKILAQNYQKADIYLTCDKFLFFGQPILEAASFAKPTIALDYAAAKEVVINNKTGVIVEDKEAFMQALLILIRSSKKRVLLGKNAQSFANDNTWEKCAISYLKELSKWAKQ